MSLTQVAFGIAYGVSGTFIAVGLGVIFLYKRLRGPFKTLALLSWFHATTVTATLITSAQGINNNFITPFYILGTGILLLSFFHGFGVPRKRSTVVLLGGLLLATLGVEIYVLQTLTKSVAVSNALLAIIVMSTTSLYLQKHFLNNFTYRHPTFWVATGSLILFCFTLFTNLSYNHYVARNDMSTLMQVLTLKNILSILQQGMLVYAYVLALNPANLKPKPPNEVRTD